MANIGWSWLASHKTELQHAFRVAIAAFLSFAVATALHLPQGFWAVITAIVVVQGSIGGTLDASRNRLIGTGVGALVGAFAAWLRPHNSWGELAALTLSVGGLSLAASMRPSLKIAPVTAVIMIVGSLNGARGFFTNAGLRIAEIALGGVFGVLVALLVFPARARDEVSSKTQVALTDLSQLLLLYAQRLEGHDDAGTISRLHAKIRSTLGAIETAVGEASRENAVRLTGARITDAIPRALWRLRNDAVMIGRASSHAWPAAVSDRLSQPAADLLRAQAGHLVSLNTALAEKVEPAPPALADSISAFRQAFKQLEHEAPPATLSFELLEQIFGLAYALEAFNHNLAEMVDRASEFTSRRVE